MMNISMLYKIKIKNAIFSVTLDNSYNDDNISTNHYHAWYEVFIVGNEEKTAFFEGEELKLKNCVLVIPPFVYHYTDRSKDYRIIFSYQSGIGSKKIPDIFSKAEHKKPFVLKNDELYEYARKIEDHLFSARQYSNEIIESLLKVILCEIIESCCETKKTKLIRSGDNYLEKIEHIIFTDFRSDINLGTVAKELNLSAKQASRIIKKNYNSSFSKMLCEQRLAAALDLMTNTDMSIAQIVERVNFPSESYFYMKFKEYYGETPNHYRKLMNERKDI